jgi:exonuclease SbcD
LLKFVVVGDIHYRGSNPRSRIDDYPAAIRAKIEEITEIAEGIRAEAILCPGDLFDGPNLSYSTVGELYEILKLTKVPWYVIPGNHDEYAANPETLSRTPFGLLTKVKAIIDPSKPFNFVCFDKYNVRTVFLTGQPYNTETDLDPSQYSIPDLGGCLVSDPGSINVFVHLVHGMAVNHSLPEMVRHTRIDQIQTDADVVITGHDHYGYGIRRYGKTLWINPGALCRVSASTAEMERPIQVAILTIDDDGTCDAELVPLKSAKPGHEVLSREHLEQQAAREQHTAEFLAQLQDAKEILDPAGLVDMIAGLEKVPERVRNEALQRLGRAKERMGVSA